MAGVAAMACVQSLLLELSHAAGSQKNKSNISKIWLLIINTQGPLKIPMSRPHPKPIKSKCLEWDSDIRIFKSSLCVSNTDLKVRTLYKGEKRKTIFTKCCIGCRKFQKSMRNESNFKKVTRFWISNFRWLSRTSLRKTVINGKHHSHLIVWIFCKHLFWTCCNGKMQD